MGKYFFSPSDTGIALSGTMDVYGSNATTDTVKLVAGFKGSVVNSVEHIILDGAFTSYKFYSQGNNIFITDAAGNEIKLGASSRTTITDSTGLKTSIKAVIDDAGNTTFTLITDQGLNTAVPVGPLTPLC